MLHQAQATGLEARKKVRVRLRPNLECSQQQSGSETYHVVKDPISLTYFRLERGQRFVVDLMDGRNTLADIQEAYEKAFRPDRLSLEELESFASMLLASGLALNESPLAGKLLFERAQKQRKRAFWQTLLNVLYIKVPVLDPDALLGRLLPVGRCLFSWWFLTLSVALAACAVGLVITRWHEVLARLPEYQEFFSFHNVLLMWLTLGVVKIAHEFGHGLCAKTMGSDVHEMGVLVLLFFPSMYCNVSDSWTLTSKWKRMAISAAGIYVELMIASLATLCWWGSDPGTFVHHLAFAAMVVCSISTIFCNANPLMRFDGYYVMSDWLEVPNLSQQASRCLQVTCLRSLGAPLPVEEAVGKVGPGFLSGFALASLIYRWVMFAVTLFCIHAFFHAHNLGSFGLLVVCVGLGSMVAGAAYRLTLAFKTSRQFFKMRPARVLLAAAVVAGLLVIGFFLPFPTKISGTALVQVDPDQVRRIVVPDTGGFLHDINVRDGQRVRVGDVLFVLTNPKLTTKLQVAEAEGELKKQQQSAHLAELTEPLGQENPGLDALQAQFDLKTIAKQQATFREQLGQLVLRAPCDGVVLGLPMLQDKGKWLEKGTELCRIGNTQTLRAVVLVDPADHKLVARGNSAKVRIHGGGSSHWNGVVTGIAQVEAKNVPPQLTQRAGGDVATQQDPITRTDKPNEQHFLVGIRLQESSSMLHPGILGRVKIDAGSYTLWTRLRGYLGTTFHWGL